MDRTSHYLTQRQVFRSQEAVLYILFRNLIPSVCLIIYCSAPLMLEAFVIWFFHLIGLDFFLIDLILGGLAIALIVKFNYSFFASQVG